MPGLLRRRLHFVLPAQGVRRNPTQAVTSENPAQPKKFRGRQRIATCERAALAWTEAITNTQQGHASDHVYELVRKEFSEEELVRLTMAIAQINIWNRISIAF